MKNMPGKMIVIPRKAGMNTDINAFFLPDEKHDETLVEHLRNMASIKNVLHVIALPNFSPDHNFVSGIVAGAQNVIIPGIIGGDINAGIRLFSVNMKTSEIAVRQRNSALKKVLQSVEHHEGIPLHEGDMRLILELGISAISDVSNRSKDISACRYPHDEEADMKKTPDNGSLVASSASIPHRAIENALNKTGTIGGSGHFFDLLSVEGIFDEKISTELGISKNQLMIAFSSGSNLIGHYVAEEYIRIAREKNDDNPPERNLACLHQESPEAEAYLDAYTCASNFAYANRQIISSILRSEIRKTLGNIAITLLFDIPYNTVSNESFPQKKLWMHRRGAARIEPPDDKGGHGTPFFIHGRCGGASYILVAGKNSRLTMNSLNINIGQKDYVQQPSVSKKQLPYRNIDEIAHFLVDTGIADIVARLKSLTPVE